MKQEGEKLEKYQRPDKEWEVQIFRSSQVPLGLLASAVECRSTTTTLEQGYQNDLCLWVGSRRWIQTASQNGSGLQWASWAGAGPGPSSDGSGSVATVATATATQGLTQLCCPPHFQCMPIGVCASDFGGRLPPHIPGSSESWAGFGLRAVNLISCFRGLSKCANQQHLSVARAKAVVNTYFWAGKIDAYTRVHQCVSVILRPIISYGFHTGVNYTV